MTEQNRCQICLADIFDAAHAPTARGPCGHVFHSACIKEWVEKHPSCVSCKAPLRASELVIPAVLLHHAEPENFETSEETEARLRATVDKLRAAEATGIALQEEIFSLREKVERTTAKLSELRAENEERRVRVTQTLPRNLRGAEEELKKLKENASLAQQNAHTQHWPLDLFPDGKIALVDPVGKVPSDSLDYLERMKRMWLGLADEERRVDEEERKSRRRWEHERRLRDLEQKELQELRALREQVRPAVTKTRQTTLFPDAVPSLPRKFTRPGENSMDTVAIDHPRPASPTREPPAKRRAGNRESEIIDLLSDSS